ncbi:MAG: hypothetical protein AB1715_07530, partial [Acidobacteriota bacterium]
MSGLNRREFLKISLAAPSVLASSKAVLPLLRAAGRRETPTKILVLGFDGLDPRLLERWMSEGKLPAFA